MRTKAPTQTPEPTESQGRSPLRGLRRARQPGESLLRRYDTVLTFNFAYCGGVAVSFLTFAVWDWVTYLQGDHRHPATTSSIALLVLALSTWRALHVYRRSTHTLKGIRGERAVGTLLEELRAIGYSVAHDLELRSNDAFFNADHVLVGPAGVFLIETKYVTKPARGSVEIRVQDDTVFINDVPARGNAIGQAIAIANDLSGRLFEHTGLQIAVVPVVVYPGWWVHEVVGRRYWVVNPTRLHRLLKGLPSQLDARKIERIQRAIDRIDEQRRNW